MCIILLFARKLSNSYGLIFFSLLLFSVNMEIKKETAKVNTLARQTKNAVARGAQWLYQVTYKGLGIGTGFHKFDTSLTVHGIGIEGDIAYTLA